MAQKSTKVVASKATSSSLLGNKKAMTIIGSLVVLVLLGLVSGVVFYYVTYGELPSLTDSSAGKTLDCSKKANKNKTACKVVAKTADCSKKANKNKTACKVVAKTASGYCSRKYYQCSNVVGYNWTSAGDSNKTSEGAGWYKSSDILNGAISDTSYKIFMNKYSGKPGMAKYTGKCVPKVEMYRTSTTSCKAGYKYE